MTLEDRLKRVKIFAMDVDGVLTDGKIIYDSEGREIKAFDVKDGFGIVFLKRVEIKTAIITARASEVVKVRAKDLRIDRVYLDAYPKIGAYEDLLKHFKASDEDVCFIGDDMADYPLLQRVGLAVAVNDAVEEIKSIAHYVTTNKGGQGAVREVINMILKAQNKWQIATQ